MIDSQILENLDKKDVTITLPYSDLSVMLDFTFKETLPRYKKLGVRMLIIGRNETNILNKAMEEAYKEMLIESSSEYFCLVGWGSNFTIFDVDLNDINSIASNIMTYIDYKKE